LVLASRRITFTASWVMLIETGGDLYAGAARSAHLAVGTTGMRITRAGFGVWSIGGTGRNNL
jgi:hypothetical protein